MALSKEDQINQISKTVFVTNFPDHIRARDLWGLCKFYRSVVDVYIPLKKSKAGKRFAFIRFIKVNNLERLIENLCTIWIDSFHLYANKVRFNRESIQKRSFNNSNMNQANGRGSFPKTMPAGNSNGSFASVLKAGVHTNLITSTPTLVLDDSCLMDRDFGNSLMCQVKEVTAIPNLQIILSEEGFDSFKLTYLGGLWVLIKFGSCDILEKFRNHVGISSWFSSIKPPINTFVSNEIIIWISIEGLPLNAWTCNTFSKIAQKWGDLIVWEDTEEVFLSRKHLCLKTKVHEIINESFKVTIKGVVHWIRAKELDAWVPKFLSDSDNSSSEGGFYDSEKESKVDQEEFNSEQGDEEVEHVSETTGMNDKENLNAKENRNLEEEKSHSSDPFNIYTLLRKENKNHSHSKESKDFDPSHPPGFTTNATDPLSKEPKDSDPSYPPGFTPNAADNKEEGSKSVNDHRNSDAGKRVFSYHNVDVPNTSMPITGGSILNVMDDLVKVGQTMGFNMEGCLKNIEEIIGVQGDINGIR